MRRPAHFKRGEETKVWERYLEKYGGEGGEYEYDVHLGPGVLLAEKTTEKFKVMWKRLTQKRIDVVFRSELGVTLFEVKDRLEPASIGQLLMYRDLWEKEFPTIPVLDLIIVCGMGDPVVEESAIKQGIDVEVV